MLIYPPPDLHFNYLLTNLTDHFHKFDFQAQQLDEQGIIISELTDYNYEDQEAIAKLLPQLTPHVTDISAKMFEEIVHSQSTFLYVARDTRQKMRIIGAVSLVIIKIPTGIKAQIEDVVVDGNQRGRGVGRALMLYALDEAKKRNVKTIDLTSNPARLSANKLYRSLGFELRETNVYRYKP